jgi:hypothetical protein
MGAHDRAALDIALSLLRYMRSRGFDPDSEDIIEGHAANWDLLHGASSGVIVTPPEHPQL